MAPKFDPNEVKIVFLRQHPSCMKFQMLNWGFLTPFVWQVWWGAGEKMELWRLWKFAATFVVFCCGRSFLLSFSFASSFLSCAVVLHMICCTKQWFSRLLHQCWLPRPVHSFVIDLSNSESSLVIVCLDLDHWTRWFCVPGGSSGHVTQESRPWS